MASSTVRRHWPLRLDHAGFGQHIAIEGLRDVSGNDGHVDLAVLQRFPSLCVAAGKKHVREDGLGSTSPSGARRPSSTMRAVGATYPDVDN